MATDRIHDPKHRARSQTPPHPPVAEPADPYLTRVDEQTQDDKTSAIRLREAAIDAELEMTFPASDPPSWTL